MKNSEKLVRFGVAMPEGLLDNFDEWVAQTGLPNRSLALRHIVRDYIAKSQWQENEGVVCGTLTIMYDHHSNDITASLTSVQHDYGDIILCTTHVHVSHETCLETLIVKGDVKRIKKFEEALSALKGLRSIGSVIAYFQ